MLDIKLIRAYPEKIRGALDKRGAGHYLPKVLELDNERRLLTKKLDDLRAEMNLAAKAISLAHDSEKKRQIHTAQKLKEQIKEAETRSTKVNNEYLEIMYRLPNLPFPEVPVGKDEVENVVMREVGKKPKFSFPPKDYLSIAERLHLIDTARAAKVSGTRFGYIKDDLVKIQFGLINLVLTRLTDERWLQKVIKKNQLDVSSKTFTPMMPPVMIRPEVFLAMGKLDPGQEDERYYLPKDQLFLVGSAEHTLGPYYMNETLPADDLPVRFIGYSTCFRREAGSYGKDTKGIIRVHQFDKLEMFSFSHPERSRAEHRLFLAIQEELMQELKLPYRVLHICTGDMVSTDSEQFDLETWLPGQNNGAGEYRETHSTSNSTDYQARRLNIKYTNGHATEFVHTINGTAFAIGRTLVALIENKQTKTGFRINI